MTSQKETRQKFLTDIIRKTSRKTKPIRIERIWGTIMRIAGREIDQGQVVVTLAELIEAGIVVVEMRTLRIGGPDGDPEEVPHFSLA